MNKFIYEIFDTIGNALPDMEQADKAITKEINNLLEPAIQRTNDKRGMGKLERCNISCVLLRQKRKLCSKILLCC